MSRSERCQRARMLSSLALDGELDALGEQELRRHLRVCPRCAQVAREYAALTVMLRDAPLAAAGHAVEPRRPRRGASVRSSLLASAVATAIAAAVALTGLGGSPASSLASQHRTLALVSNIVAVSAGNPNRLAVLAHRVTV